MLEGLACLALNIYHEARDQPIEGQVAVAQVVLERVKSNKYPNSICEVVMQGPTYSWSINYPIKHRCQFSWYCDGLSDRSKDMIAYLNSVDVAEKTLHGLKDVVKGSIYYHSVKVKPWWAKYKIHSKDTLTYFDMLPNVLSNQFGVFLPTLLVLAWASDAARGLRLDDGYVHCS